MKAALTDAMAALGIGRGSAVMVHSDAMAVAQFAGQGSEEGMRLFWQGMQAEIGTQGTLLVPTFTYSLTRQVRFDRLATPSEVGRLTEVFRTMPGVVRTGDPIFSMAVWGAGRDELASAESHDCFGPESPFAWLARHDGWIVGVACQPDRITFTHYVEQCAGVSYRFIKRFEGEVIEAGLVKPCYRDYFVRKLDLASEIDLARLVVALKAQGAWQQTLFGRLPMWAVRCSDFAAIAQELLAADPYALIREGR